MARYVIPRLGRRPIADLRRRDFIELVEQIHDQIGGRTANKVLTLLRGICRWAVSRDIIGGDPTAMVARPHQEKARQRILSDRELKAIWNACEALGAPQRALVRLLVMTGQRLSEVAGMRWDEIDEAARIWTLPAARSKTGQPNEVALADAAWAIIASLPRRGPYVLSTRPQADKPLGGHNHPKVALAARIAEIDPAALTGQWQFHDLRRTFRTRLSALGISSEIAELCVGHQKTGMVAIYNLHSFRPEKARAMQTWAQALAAIVSDAPLPSNVVPLAATGR
jgi:integrase